MAGAGSIRGFPLVVREMPPGVQIALVSEVDGVALLDDGSIVKALQVGPNEWRGVKEALAPSR